MSKPETRPLFSYTTAEFRVWMGNCIKKTVDVGTYRRQNIIYYDSRGLNAT